MKAKLTARLVKTLTPEANPFEVFDTDITGFLLRVETSGVMTYYLAYKTGKGARRRYRIGRAGNLSPVQARDQAEKLAGDVAYGKDVHAIKQEERQEADRAKVSTLGGLLEHKYGPWVTTERKTGAATLARLHHNFRAFMSRPLSEITPWIVEKWRAEQIKAGKAKTTVNRDVTALKAALSKAVDWGLIEVHPLIKVKPLKTDNRGKVRYLSTDEDKRLRQALKARDERIKAGRKSANQWRRERGYEEYPDLTGCAFSDYLTPMVLLTLNTGLRRGEVFNLAWNHVSTSTKTVTIEGATAKSGQTRHIPLNAEALAALTAWCKQSEETGLVFPGKEGKPMDNVNRSWAGVLADAKIVNFRWHDLRHDFASKLVMAGVPLNTVRELLGHSDMTTTLRYAHLAPDHKAEAVAMLASG